MFLVRAFRLSVSRTSTGDGCFLLEPRAFDSKPIKITRESRVRVVRLPSVDRKNKLSLLEASSNSQQLFTMAMTTRGIATE